jgi:DNA-binding MarR family transcriptional regulator
MTPLEYQLLSTLKEVGSYPSRFQLCIAAGVDYARGYYAIETLVARGYIQLVQPEKTRRGKAITIKLVEMLHE